MCWDEGSRYIRVGSTKERIGVPPRKEKVRRLRDGGVGEHKRQDGQRFCFDLRIGERFDPFGEVALYSVVETIKI